MRAMLGAFASSCVQLRFGADIGSGLDSALRHYDQRLRSSDAPLGLSRELDFRPERPLVEVAAELSPPTAALLEEHSRRLDVDCQLLLNHAVIVYLAELDRRPIQQCGARKRGCPPLGR